MRELELQYALSVSRISSDAIKAALHEHFVRGELRAHAADKAGVDRSLFSKRANRVKQIINDHRTLSRKLQEQL